MSQAPPTTPTPVPPAVPGKMSVTAILGLSCGIAGFCTLGLAGIVGLILSVVAVSGINRSHGALRGQGVAIAGIVVSIVSLASLVLVLPIVGLMLPALSQARNKALIAKETAQVRQLEMALNMYVVDSGGVLPPADAWATALLDGQYVSAELLATPFAPDAGRAFAMNAALGGAVLAEIENPTRTVLLFEIAPGGPASGGPELLPAVPRSPSGRVIGFADGHVEHVGWPAIDAVIWVPED